MVGKQKSRQFNFNKYMDGEGSALFKKQVYMRPVPISDLKTLHNIKDGVPVKKDRLLSLIRNSEIWIKFGRHLKKQERKRQQEAETFFKQPIEKILLQAGEL